METEIAPTPAKVKSNEQAISLHVLALCVIGLVIFLLIAWLAPALQVGFQPGKGHEFHAHVVVGALGVMLIGPCVAVVCGWKPKNYWIANFISISGAFSLIAGIGSGIGTGITFSLFSMLIYYGAHRIFQIFLYYFGAH